MFNSQIIRENRVDNARSDYVIGDFGIFVRRLGMSDIAKDLFNLQNEICNDFCKYSCTHNDAHICDYMRQNEGRCPLDTLTNIILEEKKKQKREEEIRRIKNRGRI